MKNLLRKLRTKIQKWLILDDVYLYINQIKESHKYDVDRLDFSLSSRRYEIDGLIESFQNLDNNEVIRDLHKRIETLENKQKEL